MNGPATALGTFILVILADWLALTAIIYWMKPNFYTEDDKVNWWTTLWVVLLLIIFAGIIMAIVGWLFMSSQQNGCAPQCAPQCPKPDPCPQPCLPCQPQGLGC